MLNLGITFFGTPGSHTPSDEFGVSTDELKTAENAENILSQNLNIIGTDLVSIHSMEDSIKTNPSVEINLGEAAESKNIKDHETGLQRSNAQTYESRDMGETTSDDEEENMGNISSDNKDEDMGDTSSDDKGENNMMESSIFKDESKLTQVESPNNKQKSEVCSSNREGKDI